MSKPNLQFEYLELWKQLIHIDTIDSDILFEGCKILCGWLTDGHPQDEPQKHKQPCPRCGGYDRFGFAPVRKHFFCNHCRQTIGWDGIALVKEFADVGELKLHEAVRLLAEATGYGTNSVTFFNKRRENEIPKPTLKTFELREDSDTFRAVQKKRPEIDFITYKKTGTEGFHGGIAIPMFDNEGEKTGHVRYFKDGSKKNSQGSKSGIVGIDARDALLSKRQAKMVFKCPGVSDYLVLLKLITEAGLEVDYYAFTNGAGEMENPGKFESILMPALEGQTVVILQDNDEAGEKGARKWAKNIATFAKDVRIVSPPKEWKGKTIKDFRDFVAVVDNGNEVFRWITEAFENTEPITADTIATWNQFEFAKQGKTGKSCKDKRQPKLVRLNEVERKPITWLWENKIPFGMLSLITGFAGIGKSFWTVFMAANITNGENWPDGSPCEEGSVLFFHGEEGIADTYKIRFQANNADESKIVFLNGVESIDENKEHTEIDVTLKMVDIIETVIHQTTEKTGFPVKMVVIDPISNYWGDIKENSNVDVRSVLKPLQLLAERTGVAFVVIQHLGKGERENAQQQVLGSTGIVATCRSVWGVYIAPDDRDKRIFVPVKVNCGFEHTAVSYKITPPDGKVEVVENSIKNLTGDDIRKANAPKRGRRPEKRDACLDCLERIMADGPRLATEVKELLKAEGFGSSLIQEAKKLLGIKSIGKGQNTRWVYPSDSDDDNAD